MVLDKSDPTKVSLSIFIEGDDQPVKTPTEIHQPDNIESTPQGLLITEDPGSSQQFLPTDTGATTARIMRFTFATGLLDVAARVDQLLDDRGSPGSRATRTLHCRALGRLGVQRHRRRSAYFGRSVPRNGSGAHVLDREGAFGGRQLRAAGTPTTRTSVKPDSWCCWHPRVGRRRGRLTSRRLNDEGRREPPPLFFRLPRRNGSQQILAVALELRRPDARHAAELGETPGRRAAISPACARGRRHTQACPPPFARSSRQRFSDTGSGSSATTGGAEPTPSSVRKRLGSRRPGQGQLPRTRDPT